MSTLAHGRRLAVAVSGVAAIACALGAPAATAHASTSGYTPNAQQWYFSKWGIQQDIWPTTEGAGVTVAVVDSGVQANIPDLQGVVEPGADMLGDPGNGEKDYASDNGHGTAMAALIAGQGIDGGPVGLAPQAKILPVHAINPSNGMAPVSKGIRYAADHNAGVINLSLGATAGSATECDPSLQQAVSYALKRNSVVIAASGDSNRTGSGPAQPGTCSGVLTVGGVEPNGSLWPDSVQGPQVSVAGPGDDVFIVSSDGHDYSATSSGTSGAAALVSAAAALIKSKNPSMPWYTIDQRLTDTAVPVGHVPNSGTGFGIIDLNKALHVSQYPVSASAPNPTYARYQNWLKSTGQSSSAGGTGSRASSGKSGGGSGIWLIVGIVVVVLIIAAVVIIILATRGRSRRGPRNPGGGYPPNAYAAPGQQYPPGRYPPGQYPQPRYPQPPQYPQPGQYPPGQQPPGGQYPPPGGQQYPPGSYRPGEYPPPQQ